MANPAYQNDNVTGSSSSRVRYLSQLLMDVVPALLKYTIRINVDISAAETMCEHQFEFFGKLLFIY